MNTKSERRNAKSGSKTTNSPGLKDELRFEANGQSYMLSFNREDGRWYLLTATITGGVKAIPVVNDDGIIAAANVVVPIGDPGAANVN